MPADMVNTNELRFIERVPPPRSPVGTSNGDVNAVYLGRIQRILQQRWVVVGTMQNAELTAENSEWRDVPLVEEGAAKTWCPGCSRDVDGVCHLFNCAIGPHGMQAQIDARNAGKPPPGQPPSWLQEQERKDP